MSIALQGRFALVEDIFVGPQGVYMDRIAILAGGGAAILISLFLYEALVAGPAGRQAEGERLMKKAMPELVVFMLRDQDGKLPANFMSRVAASGIKMQQTAIEAVAVNFGYSDPLYLNELSNRAALMKATTKDVLVEAAMRLAHSDGRAETAERAQRLIKSLGRLSSRSSRMAKDGLPASLRRAA